MPLTSGSVTIKTSAGTYSSWAAFWDDIGNLTGDITCTVDASAFTENVTPGTVTEELNGYTLHVLPTSFPTTTDASTGARFTCIHGSTILSLEMEGAGVVAIEGMVLIDSGGATISITNINTEFNCTIRRNIMKNGVHGIYTTDPTMNAGLKIYNNIIFDCAAVGLAISVAPLAMIANNTMVNCGFQVDCGNSEATIRNVLSYGGITNDFRNIGLAASGFNNADSDNTGEDANWGAGGAGSGSNNVSGISDPFENLASDDFRITSPGVIGSAGLGLSIIFTNDFFGIARDNWTIGACEYITPPPPKFSVSVIGGKNITYM